MPRWGGWLTAALAVTLLGGCREEEDPAERQSVREATITAEVHSRLVAVEALRSLPLAVETRAGTVRVSGGVQDSSQAAAIRSITAAVRGVERVELDLRPLPPPPDTMPPARSPARRRSAPPAPPAEPLPPLEEAG